jgi:hypothetical protein
VSSFSQSPTLGEIIKRAVREFGFTIHTISDPEPGRRRRKLKFLRRGDPNDPNVKIVDLPYAPETERLTRTVARGLCEKIGIPKEDFGLD